MNMKNYFKIAGLLLLVMTLTTTLVVAGELRRAPDFKLQDMQGNFVSLSSYKDKQPVLLFFWTTWCPFCRRELRLLNDKYSSLSKDGLELLSVNIGESAQKVDRFIKNYNLGFPVLLDRDSEVAGKYEILGVPTYTLIDKKGYIVFEGNYFPQDYKNLVSGRTTK